MSNANAIEPSTLSLLQSWVGKTENTNDTITAVPARALSATLDRDDAAPVRGATLPPLWHWLYFLPTHAQSEIGIDGHPKRGGFLPPVPLPRRMWAGGRLHWESGNPLVVGDEVHRESCILSVKHKAGRSGDLVFVVVQHTFHNHSGLAITEEQDIVYRAAAQPGDPAPHPVAADKDAPWQRALSPNEVLLFRYSALTLNGHRIHYDRPYATGEEAYPGLVVHGPLIATLLVDLVRRENPQVRVRSFDFKAVRPSFDGLPLRVCGRPASDSSAKLWAQDHEGWLAMQADICFS